MARETDDAAAGKLSPPPWGFWATAGFGLVILGTFYVTQSLAFGIVYSLSPPATDVPLQSYTSDGDVLSLLTLVSGTASLLLIAVLAFIRSRHPTAYVGFATRPEPSAVLTWVAVAFGLGTVHTFLAPAAGVASPPDFLVKVWASTDCVAWLVLGVAVMAPLFEETFFRGFLYRGWGESLGVVWTATLTTLLWTAVHVQYGWYERIYIGTMGLLLTAARFQTNSLWTPLCMHAVNNGLALACMALENTTP